MRIEWRWARVPVLLACVLVASVTAIHLAPSGSNVATWWPAAGIAAALLIGTRRDRWPLVLALLVAVTWAANRLSGRELGVSVAFAFANATEALVVSLVLGAHRRRPVLRAARDLARLCLAALAGAAVIGLIAGVTVASLLDGGLWITARNVMSAHLASLLLILPLALSARDGSRHETPSGLTSPLGLVCVAVTFGAFTSVFAWGELAALAFLPLPALVWAALVLPRREVSALALVVGLLVTLATAEGLGPLAVDAALGPTTVGALAQLYLVVLFFVTIPLVLLVEQRTSALAMATAVLDATTANAIIGTDPDGTITFFNVGAERMLGWSAAEVIGGRPRDFYLLPPEGAESTGAPDLAGLREVLTRNGDRIAALGTDQPWRRHDGSTLVVSAAVTPIRSETGAVEGFLTVAADVTQRLEAKQRLRDSLAREQASVAELERVDRLKTEFVSAVSHELRTPLTTILGNTQLLAAEIPGPLCDDQAQAVERIHRNGRRLLMLIEDLLTLTSLESRASARQDPVRAGDVLAAAAGQAEDLVGDRALEVRIEDGAADAVVRADADELERALVNLVGNAVKFTPDGGVVTVGSRIEDGVVVWTVRDTGIGVPEDEAAHLFERFFRSSTVVSLAIQGTGLGLSIVRTIAEAHGGSVHWLPHDGPGSSFELRIPLARPTPTSSEVTPVEVAP